MGIKTPFDPMGVLLNAAVDPYKDASMVLRHDIRANYLNYETHEIGITPGGSFDIDWGDGTRETFTTGGIKTHTFAMPGTYDVQTIDPTNSIISLGQRPKIWTWKVDFLFEIIKFKFPSLTSMGLAFHTCIGLRGDVPDLTTSPLLTDIHWAFYYCNLLTGANANMAAAVSSQASISATWPNLTNTALFVSYCPEQTTAVFPTTWGGTKTIS